jgi:hypothetical protein
MVMRYLRQSLRVAGVLAGLLVALLVVAVLVSQTSWFRDWLRRYAMREAAQFVDGQLIIGRVEGGLLDGVQLHDVRLDRNGETVIALETLALHYSLVDMARQGIVVERVDLVRPRVALRREGDTWNVATLLVDQGPSDPDAPRTVFRVDAIVLRDGVVTVDDPTCPPGTSGCLPARIERINAEVGLASTAEALDVALRDAGLVTVSPALTLHRLAFDLRATDADLDVSGLEMRTDASALTGGVQVSDYATTPAVQASLKATPLALAEVGRFVPQFSATTLTPAVSLDVAGPLDALRLDLDVTSAAGDVRAALVADANGPTYAAKGTAAVDDLDAGAVLADPSRTTAVTARAEFDVTGADVASLAGNVLLEATQLAGMGYEAEALRAQARFAAGTAKIDADLRAYGTSATAVGNVDYGGFDQGALSYDLTGTVRELNVRQLPPALRAPAIDSDISLDYSAAGTLDRTNVTATFLPSTIETAVIERGTVAELSLDGPTVAYRLNGAVRNVNIQRFGRVLEVAALDAPALVSDVDARLAVQGRGVDLTTAEVTADVHVTDSSFAAGRVPDLRVRLSADRGAIAAQAAGRVEDVRPDVITGRADLAGTVSGTLDITASLPDLSAEIEPAGVTAEARVRLDASEVGGLRLDEVVVDARIDQGVGDVRDVRVVSPVIDVQASGPVSLVQDGATRVAYRVDVKDAGTLASLAGVERVAGTAHLDGELTGWLRQLETRGRLAADDVVYGDTASVEHAEGTYTVAVPDLEPGRASAALDATATRLDASGTLLDAVAIDARYADRQVDFDGEVVRDTLRVGAGGGVRLDESGQHVSLRQLDASGDGLSWTLAADAAPSITHEAGAVRIEDLRLVDGAQRLEVSGRIQLPSEQAPLSFDGLAVDAAGVDLSPLGAQLVPERQLAGRLDASIVLTGTLYDGRGRATVRVQDGGAQGFVFESLDVAADYANGSADLDLTLRQNAASSLTAVGDVPVAAALGTVPAGVDVSERIDVAVNSTGIDLAVLEGVTPQVSDVRGRLFVDARVTGTPARPEVNGNVRVEGGAFRVALVDAAYEGVEANLRLTPQQVRVETLQLADGRGNPLRVTGTLGIADAALGDVDLTATASEFRVLDNDLGDVRLTTDLTVTGTPSAPVIRGTVSVPDSRVEVDRLLLALAGTPREALRNDVDMVYVPEVEDTQEEQRDGGESVAPTAAEEAPEHASEGVPQADEAEPGSSLLDAATIDVQLTIPDDLVLRGDDVRVVDGGTSLGALNVTVGADLRAAQTPGEPLLVTGLVNTVRGYYDFQGRRFTVVRDGGIRFEGDDVTNPTLDLAATRDISGVEARIDIEGTAQAPELVLSSTPALDEADILALIIFNRPLDDLGTGEQVTLAQRAGALVGGRLTGALATSLRDALDVDQFEIDAFAASGPSVTVGNRIGDRIYVRLRQQLGSQDASQILLEYELLKNLRLQTSMTQGARTDRSPGRRVERSGIDLLYFFYY